MDIIYLMSWTAPAVTRVDEPLTAGERESLDGFLNWYRGTLLFKCSGLTAEQLAERAIPPSNLSLLGLIRHLAEVERGWFRRRVDAQEIERLYTPDRDSDADLDAATAASAEADYATYVAELDLCRAAAAGHELEELIYLPERQRKLSVRWTYLHLIEEYARHCGHADLIRERIDGTRGS
jgi:uncharacterized damage-inducible protein DinB